MAPSVQDSVREGLICCILLHLHYHVYNFIEFVTIQGMAMDIALSMISFGPKLSRPHILALSFKVLRCVQFLHGLQTPYFAFIMIALLFSVASLIFDGFHQCSHLNH